LCTMRLRAGGVDALLEEDGMEHRGK
jgi:hypothetical protein